MIEILDVWMSWLALGVFVLGAGMALLGNQFGMSGILGGGVAAMGGAGLISGLESILTRKSAFVPWSIAPRETGAWGGLAGVLWGLMLLVVGSIVVVLGGAIALVPDNLAAFLNRFFESRLGWATIGVILGCLAFILGLMRVLQDSASNEPSAAERLRQIATRFGGVLMMILGLALAGGGVIAGVAPGWGASLLARAAAVFLSGLP